MGTFLGVAAFIFFVFLRFTRQMRQTKKLNNAIKTTEKMEERLDAMEMRLNELLQKLGGGE